MIKKMKDRLDEFTKTFLEKMHIAMSGAGRQLSNGEVVIVNEFVKQAKANNLILVSKE